jgi:hypothetical protein
MISLPDRTAADRTASRHEPHMSLLMPKWIERQALKRVPNSELEDPDIEKIINVTGPLGATVNVDDV